MAESAESAEWLNRLLGTAELINRSELALAERASVGRWIYHYRLQRSRNFDVIGELVQNNVGDVFATVSEV